MVLVRGSVDRIELPPTVELPGAKAGGTEGGGGGRVVVMRADLSSKDLGLSTGDRARLRGMRIDCILHSAAVVDHSRPYEALRATNVNAATNLLDLLPSPPLQCVQGAPPQFILVSTMSVIPVATAAMEVGWTGSPESLIPPGCALALDSGYC